VNAASYLPPGFTNQGIARGSLFVILGSNLGPPTLTKATSFPLEGNNGLAGTRIRIDTATYTGYALMLYTSAKQVGAILPSATPEGDATLTLNYNNLTSNPIVVHVVRSAFGTFTLNQGGRGPAVVQNFINQSLTPINTVMNSATPGQTVILWGTGLGPVAGDESAGTVPGALSGLDSVLVGGQAANVRFAGRTVCCAGIDEIIFDVPANVSGCYVPVVVTANGVPSNAGTIAVSPNGGECDDPLSFRKSELQAAERNNKLRVGMVQLWSQNSPGALFGMDTLNASFLSYTPQTLAIAAATVNPPAGSCFYSQTPVTADPLALPHGSTLDAGTAVLVNGQGVSINAAWVSPGVFSGTSAQPALPAGLYNISSDGGGDVGALRNSLTVAPTVQWTNLADLQGPFVNTGQPLTLRWTGGDSKGYVTIAIDSTGITLAESIVCNASASAGSFTLPGWLTRTIPQGTAQVTLSSFGAPVPLSGSVLDAGNVLAGSRITLQVNFQTPAAN
jgi:uncharacterized protein (TIGR03437 family)